MRPAEASARWIWLMSMAPAQQALMAQFTVFDRVIGYVNAAVTIIGVSLLFALRREAVSVLAMSAAGDQGRLLILERGQFRLQGLGQCEVAGNKARGAGRTAVAGQCLGGGINEFGMPGQPEIVVGGEIEQPRAGIRNFPGRPVVDGRNDPVAVRIAERRRLRNDVFCEKGHAHA